jgi:hypothetical protein
MVRARLEALTTADAKIVVQLDGVAAPVIAVLHRARRNACVAVDTLLLVDCNHRRKKLLHEVMKFDGFGE